MPQFTYITRSFRILLAWLLADSGRMGTQKPGFGYQMYHGEMGLRQVEQRHFFIFCQLFVIFDDFSKWSTLKNFEKSTNMAKIWQKMKKALFNLP